MSVRSGLALALTIVALSLAFGSIALAGGPIPTPACIPFYGC